MDLLNRNKVIESFFNNLEESNNYLSQYGNTGYEKNIGVSLSYEHIAKVDPLFIWFSAATMGSIQVGKTINLVNNLVLSHCENTKTISSGFSHGNQEIHNNMVALYYAYKDYGIEGLQLLRKFDANEEYITNSALKAFWLYTDIKLQAQEYANEVNRSINDPVVIHHVLNQKSNIDLLKEASIKLVEHEQVIVQSMYNKNFSGKTVGETLNNASYVEKLIANKIEISGAKILDKYISADGYDLSNYDQRMLYFNKVFDEYFAVLAQEDGFERLTNQREMMVASLDAEFIAYGEHFQPSQQATMSLAEVVQEDPEASTFYAFTWGDNDQHWHTIKDSDIALLPKGIWVPAEGYPEMMAMIEQFSLVDKTFYYDSVNNQSYLFSSTDFLPNLPPNYRWIALKTYLEPAMFHYKEGGSLWIVKQLNTEIEEANAVETKLTLAEIIDSADDSLQSLLSKHIVPQVHAEQSNAIDLPIFNEMLSMPYSHLLQNSLLDVVAEIS